MLENFLIQTLEWLQSKWNNYVSPMIIVKDWESGVVLRLGKFHRYLNKGVNWKWFFPFEEAHKCLIKPETISVNVTITTLDGKSLSVEVVGEYEVKDVKLWIIDANDAPSNVRDLLMGFSEDVLSDSNSEEINKKPIKTKIKNKLNEGVKGLGAEFSRILFGKNVATRSISLSGVEMQREISSLML